MVRFSRVFICCFGFSRIVNMARVLGVSILNCAAVVRMVAGILEKAGQALRQLFTVVYLIHQVAADKMLSKCGSDGINKLL
jgi:hypothetical protein